MQRRIRLKKEIIDNTSTKYVPSCAKKYKDSYLIEYDDKNYKINNQQIPDSKIIAISLFSGAGGLDIGSHLANVKVISSILHFIM